MDDLVLTEQNKPLVAALHHGGETPPLPFERDIFLIGVEIAGTTHVPNIEFLYNALQEGDRVQFFREPENEFDEYAVRIDAMPDTLQPEGPAEVLPPLKLGYIPRAYNKMPARLMDAGKNLYGVVRKKEKTDMYHLIVVKIFLRD